MKCIIIFFVSLMLSSFTAFPQEQNNVNKSPGDPIQVTRIRGGVVFDGVPDEIVWQSLEALPLVMLMPVPGNQPTEESVVKADSKI